jgi:hypothetical protein
MSRIAFVTWNGGGNLGPALAMARELGRRGHRVAFLGTCWPPGPTSRPHAGSPGSSASTTEPPRRLSPAGLRGTALVLRVMGAGSRRRPCSGRDQGPYAGLCGWPTLHPYRGGPGTTHDVAWAERSGDEV